MLVPLHIVREVITNNSMISNQVTDSVAALMLYASDGMWKIEQLTNSNCIMISKL